jgi:hypothetical protein
MKKNLNNLTNKIPIQNFIPTENTFVINKNNLISNIINSNTKINSNENENDDNENSIDKISIHNNNIVNNSQNLILAHTINIPNSKNSNKNSTKLNILGNLEQNLKPQIPLHHKHQINTKEDKTKYNNEDIVGNMDDNIVKFFKPKLNTLITEQKILSIVSKKENDLDKEKDKENVMKEIKFMNDIVKVENKNDNVKKVIKNVFAKQFNFDDADDEFNLHINKQISSKISKGNMNLMKNMVNVNVNSGNVKNEPIDIEKEVNEKRKIKNIISNSNSVQPKQNETNTVNSNNTINNNVNFIPLSIPNESIIDDKSNLNLKKNKELEKLNIVASGLLDDW